MSDSASPMSRDGLAVRLDRKDPHLRIICINIYVRDQDRSLRFYVDQLGFKLVVDSNFGSRGRWVAVSPPDGTAILGLVAPNPNSEEYKLIGRPTHVVLETEDVHAKFRDWSGRGVRFHHPPETQPWGATFTTFEDADGNSFMLMGREDFVRELEAQRRAIEQKLESDRRARQELEIAKQVQTRLFPQTLPPLRTLDYAGICLQAREVGGDYYDFLNLGRERLGLVIGDISGKGIAAALLMANLQANLRSQCAIASNHPQRFLRSVNELFFENTADNVYATLFFAEYDDGRQRMRFVNCGHLSALLLRNDHSVERLSSTSTVLGLFKEWDCALEERCLLQGDTLALYTDGVTESFDDAGEEFGEPRLVEALGRHREMSSQEVLTAVVDEVQRFSPHERHDDMTLIIAKCLGA